MLPQYKNSTYDLFIDEEEVFGPITILLHLNQRPKSNTRVFMLKWSDRAGSTHY